MTKGKAKREGPLKVEMDFDEAIRRTLQVKPPPEGWSAYEAKLRRRKRRSTKAR